MSNLRDFFADKVEKVENVKYVASKRIKSGGKPAEWELQIVPPSQDAIIKKQCTKQVALPIKGQFKNELDLDLYAIKMTAASVVFPDLTNAELQNSFKVMGEVDLLRAMLTIGELNDLMIRVQELNGMKATMDDLVEEAKN